MKHFLRGIGAAGFLVANTVLWCVPIYALGGLRPLVPGRAALRLGDWMFRALELWVAGARRMAAALGVVRLEPDVPSDASAWRKDGWYVVVSNHQSWADILVLVFALYGAAPPCKFFTKRQLLWLPLVGLALWFLDYPLVRRYGRERLAAAPELGEQDRRATRAAVRRFRERPTSALIFLEGTRFTPAKRIAQASPHRSLLKPKTGGFALVLDELGDRLSGVIDVAIRYPGEPPSFWEFLCGRARTVRLRMRLLPPPPPDAVRGWVDELWAEKDRHLAAAASETAHGGR